MNILERIEADAGIVAEYIENAYNQNPNRSKDEQSKWAYLAVNLGVLAVEENLTVESAIELMVWELEKHLDRNEIQNDEWVYDMRRINAYIDILLGNEVDALRGMESNYECDCQEEPASFKRRSLKDPLAEDRPTDEIKKELLPV